MPEMDKNRYMHTIYAHFFCCFSLRKPSVQHLSANIDEDTSGYLSDSRTSPIMWAEHQPQTQRCSKNHSNYMYPDNMIDVANGFNGINVDGKTNRQISSQQDDNDNESDFIIPK